MKTCENMYKKAKELADKIDDENDEFKKKAPLEMNQIYKDVTQIIDRYKKVEE